MSSPDKDCVSVSRVLNKDSRVNSTCDDALLGTIKGIKQRYETESYKKNFAIVSTDCTELWLAALFKIYYNGSLILQRITGKCSHEAVATLAGTDSK